ncbi:MAG: NUDIX domain-containing protein [Alphaproteobacteria bacterium]|nr:NUDIX domain-containing protein [Alphaproteobacteria bacterium]
MTQALHSFVLCPNMIILRNQKILLLRRADWAPLWSGHWHCPIGKMEENESPLQTAVRETYEEVGLQVNPHLGTIIVVKAPDFQNPELIWKDISFFFVAENFEGEPINKESRLHDAMDWFDVNHLPEPIIPVVRFGVEKYVRGEAYGEFGYKCE